MAGAVHIPVYATGFRGDQMADALAEIANISLRYGATRHLVYRNRDDRYKFLLVADFPDKTSWERYWMGPEFSRWRAVHMSWYQVPLLYAWHDIVTEGSLGAGAEAGELGGVA
jgi:hypothetical protein